MQETSRVFGAEAGVTAAMGPRWRQAQRKALRRVGPAATWGLTFVWLPVHTPLSESPRHPECPVGVNSKSKFSELEEELSFPPRFLGRRWGVEVGSRRLRPPGECGSQRSEEVLEALNLEKRE